MSLLYPIRRQQMHTVPVIPVRDVVVFPNSEIVLTFGRTKSILAIEAAVKSGKTVALFTQKDESVNNPKISDLYRVGTLCQVERTLKNDNELNVLVRGTARIRLSAVTQEDPYQVAEVIELEEIEEKSQEFEALARHLTTQFKTAVNLGKQVEFMNFMRLMSGVSAAELSDAVAASLTTPLADKQKLLEITTVKMRLERVLELLNKEINVLELEKKIASRTQEKFSKSMKENVLRERMETIKQELGEMGDDEKELDDLKKAVDKLVMPKKSKEKVKKELKRLGSMSPHNPEAGYLRTWLDTVTELPWGKLTPDYVSLKTAEKVLNNDHYGLDEVKERILEYLAVMKLRKKQNKKGALPTILCFVGPPGVGKTSLGKSIARALKRKFVKISLGGIRDEAEIRGHRKTYVGAMPGRIIDGIKSAGSSNPVFMLDEIDKVGNDFRGDPSSALLEALDPEQNNEFSDHYLELPYDLSEVTFIATANILDTIPPALRDRLEIIRFNSYTSAEKYHIASRYLLPKVTEKNALKPKDLHLSQATLSEIIRSYTKEAGVRSLERELSRLARKIARDISSGKRKLPLPTVKTLAKYLGPVKYLPTLAEKSHPVGMATGMAWTSVGGDILFIEVSTMPGKGGLKITGQLGDVMKESAQAAHSYVRAHWQELGLKQDFIKNIDIHIHVPEGAVPKDGPSAGVTMVTALVSALTQKKVRKDLAMTGEITLRGRVLEIGGLKEKIIAAHSAGLKQIIFPAHNARDLEKIPLEVKSDLTLHPVETVADVLKLALL